ncbi:MAG: response regulator [Bradyrhizobium sp.]|uniref:response regulator n=1 Tax=Bradyrhizobium sp. TaxID=376 RepID=UPI001E10958A|nr:response regulator [Bradyrhizobium sp.]
MSEVALAGKRVLVVEDESLVTMLIEDTLAEIGCEPVAFCSKYEDAMCSASTLSCDVVLLDVNLNGYQTFPIAAALLERDIPFVFVTGYGSAGLSASLRHAPVVQKPFRSSDLENALRAALTVRSPGGPTAQEQGSSTI